MRLESDITQISAQLNNSIITIITTRAPPNTDRIPIYDTLSPDYEKTSLLYGTLRRRVTEAGRRGQVIVAGDLNETRTASDRLPLRGSKQEARFLGPFLGATGLHDVFRTLHPDEPGFTFSRTEKGASRIDYILVTQPLLRQVTSCSTLDPITANDHLPLTAHLQLETASAPRCPERTTDKLTKRWHTERLSSSNRNRIANFIGSSLEARLEVWRDQQEEEQQLNLMVSETEQIFKQGFDLAKEAEEPPRRKRLSESTKLQRKTIRQLHRAIISIRNLLTHLQSLPPQSLSDTRTPLTSIYHTARLIKNAAKGTPELTGISAESLQWSNNQLARWMAHAPDLLRAARSKMRDVIKGEHHRSQQQEHEELLREAPASLYEHLFRPAAERLEYIEQDHDGERLTGKRAVQAMADFIKTKFGGAKQQPQMPATIRKLYARMTTQAFAKLMTSPSRGELQEAIKFAKNNTASLGFTNISAIKLVLDNAHPSNADSALSAIHFVVCRKCQKACPWRPCH